MMVIAALAGLILGGAGLALAIALPLAIDDADEDWLHLAAERPGTVVRASLAQRSGAVIRQNPLLATGFITAALALAMVLLGVRQPGLREWGVLVLAIGLLTLALADHMTRLLPDALTQPLLWLGLLAQIPPGTRTVGLESAVLGAVLGYGVPWVIAGVYGLFRPGASIGMGDLKLLAMLGAWLGPSATFAVLFVAAVASVVARLALILLGRARIEDEYPFGPWLCLGGLICSLWLVLHPA